MSIDAVKVLSMALVNTTQNISQGSRNAQIVNMDCSSDACTRCIQFFKQEDEEELGEVFCKPACTCRLQDVNMRQIIVLDLKSNLTTDNTQLFINHFVNSLYEDAYQQNTGLLNFGNKMEEFRTTLTEIYNIMQTDVFQESLQNISTLQQIDFRGPGVIATVEMEVFVEMVSDVIISSEVLNEAIVDLEMLISTVSSQIIEAGLETLIEWIVMIVIIGIILYIAGLSVSFFFKAFSLAAKA